MNLQIEVGLGKMKMSESPTLPAELQGNDSIDWEYRSECPNCFVTVCEVCTGSRTCLCKCNGVERNVSFLEKINNEL